MLVGGRYSYTALLLTLALARHGARLLGLPGARRPTTSRRTIASASSRSARTTTSASARRPRTLTLFGTEFHRVDLRYDHRLGSRGTLRTAFTLGLDRSLLQDRSAPCAIASPARAPSSSIASRRSVLVRAGTDLQLDRYDVELGSNDLSPSAARVAEFFPSRTDLAFGARADMVIDLDSRFEVTPGVRVDLFGSQGAAAVAVDPRLALRTEVTRARWRCSARSASRTSRRRSWSRCPGFQPGGLRGGLQQAIQESIGLEIELGEATIATATVFHNAFFDMSDPLGAVEPIVSGCAPGQFPTRHDRRRSRRAAGRAVVLRRRASRRARSDPIAAAAAGKRADSRGGRRVGRGVRGAHDGRVVRPRALS